MSYMVRWAQLGLKLLVLSCLFVGVSAEAENKSSTKKITQKSAEKESWSVNLKDVDIRSFIAQVAEMTGRSFIVDPRVKGKVTVISKQPLNKHATYELFLSVLHVHNFAAIQSGDVIKIVQSNSARSDNVPLSQGRVRGERLITRVIEVKNSPAQDLVPILRPLVPQYGHLAGVASANALIISDHAENIHRILQIIAQLDKAGSEELELVELEHAWVGDVVALLEKVTSVATKSGSKSSGGRVTVVADERTNRLIVKGEKSARKRIMELVAKLDVPSTSAGTIQVIKLNHANAKDVADILKGLMDGKQASAKGKGKDSPSSALSIFPDEALNALVVRAEPSVISEIRNVVGLLDVRRAQVLIEAAIVEVFADSGQDLGIIMAAAKDGQPVGGISFNGALSAIGSAAVTGTAPPIADGITIGAGNKNKNGTSGALLQALLSTGSANLLSTPSLMTLDNQEASIIVGENVPFVTGSSTGSNNSNPFTTIKREDVGITLKVTPHITDGDTIRLEVEQQASVVKGSSAGASDIITSKREIKTTILAEDMQTVVLGGLMKDDISVTVQKVPVLGDIPLLGVLFRATRTSQIKTNLLVFLKPTILRSAKSATEVTTDKYKTIRSMQFQLDEKGDISRIKNTGLPEDVNGLYKGLTVESEK